MPFDLASGTVIEIDPPQVPELLVTPPTGAVVDVVVPAPPGVLVAPPPVPTLTVIPPQVTTLPVLVVQGPPGPPGPQGSGGGSGSQVLLTVLAAITLSGHRVVTPLPDGTVTYADNTTAAHLHAALWVTMGAAATGTSVDVLLYGVVTEPSWSWLPGPLYLGANGLLTQTPPSTPSALFLTPLGAATSPTSVCFDPQTSISLA